MNLIVAEDVLFNLQAWSRNPKVRITSCKLYNYINYANKTQLTKNRDYSFVKKSIDSFVILFEEIASLNIFFKEKYGSNNMETIFKSLLRPFISRILSSNISTKDFKIIILRLKNLHLLPVQKPITKYTKAIIIIIKTYPLLPIYQKIYQKIVIPYIIPRIDRETGKFSFRK